MKDDKKKLPGEGFETETHNPPSLVRKSGIHLQLGKKGECFHRPLEDVLTGLFANPTTALGGRNRDISGPIDYGNEMRIDPGEMVVQIGGETGKDGFGGSGRRPKK